MRKPNPPNVSSLLSLARPAAVCAVAALLVFSCVLDAPKTETAPEDVTPKPLSELLSIDDARSLFEGNAGTIDLFGPGTRSDDLPEPDILWEEAIYSAFFGYEVIESQIGNIIAATHSADDPDIWGVTVGDLIPANTVLHLISGIDSSDSVRFRIVHLIPSTSFLKAKRINLRNFRLWDTAEGYTGAIHLFELTGEFVKGFLISDGVITHFLSEHTHDADEDCDCGSDRDTEIIRFTAPVSTGTGNGEDIDGDRNIEVVNIIATRITYATWEISRPRTGHGLEDPWDGRGGSTGGGGGNNNPQPKCSVCQTTGNCACCEECDNNYCYCPICHGEQGMTQCDCCLECENIRTECECCTECHKKVCQCLRAESEDPCENLMNKLKDPAYKDLLDWMKREGVSLTYESGKAHTYNGNTFSVTSVNGNPNEPWINANPLLYPDNMTGYVHCHYLGLLKTFSPDDLIIPYFWYANGKIMDLGSFSFGLVNPDGSVYYLFITDVAKYKNNCELFGPELLIRRLDQSYVDNRINLNTSDSNAAKKLAKILKDMDIGMTLMKMNSFGTGFKEMKYNGSTGKVTEVECRTL